MKTSVKYGLILGGSLMVFPLILYGIGMDKDESMYVVSSVINIIFPALFIFLGIKEARDTVGNGYISFGNGFSTGMVISLVGGALSALFSYLYFAVLNPSMVTFIRMREEQKMIEERGMTEENVAQLSSTMEFWTSPAMMSAFSFLGMIILGAVLSLICAGILKKENPAAQVM
jgi:hypothetical protein